MADNPIQYFHDQLTNAQNKYTYFLLAAAASAIALALNRTAGLPLSYDQIPLGISVLFWGLSFYFGCRYIGWLNATLRANATFLAIQSGRELDVGIHPQLRQAAVSGIKEAAEYNASKANTSGKLQFGFLIAGAVFYIAWHVLQMALRSRAIPLHFASSP